ncbi:MAG TPA: hypothetical protein VG937_20500 [Polyangiaceae bacterium]|nr:hypothetical protein [Polyangiaceae bacterium]
MKMVGWVLGFLFAVTSIGVGCLPHSCTDIGCVGGDVAVALVDDSGAPVAARGEVRRSAHREVTFDCTVASSGGGAEADCVNNVLQLDPVNGNRETTELRFRLEDGSFTDWRPVDVTITEGVAKDLGGPDCDCRYLNGTAEPVTVPAAARLSSN